MLLTKKRKRKRKESKQEGNVNVNVDIDDDFPFRKMHELANTYEAFIAFDGSFFMMELYDNAWYSMV